MRVSDTLEAAYSDQVTLELWASISYLQMSAWFESKDLPGMASWMRIQSTEENGSRPSFHRLSAGPRQRAHDRHRRKPDSHL